MLASKLGTHLAPPILLNEEELAKELHASEKYSQKLYKYLPSRFSPSNSSPVVEEQVLPLSEEESSLESDHSLPLEEDTDLSQEEDSPSEEVPEGATASSMASLIEAMNQHRPYPLPSEFREQRFELDYGGEDFDHAFADIVFPGVGWISATGKAEEPLIFRAQGFSEPYIREAIMPLEANRDKRKARGYKKHGKLSHYRYSPDESLSPKE